MLPKALEEKQAPSKRGCTLLGHVLCQAWVPASSYAASYLLEELCRTYHADQETELRDVNDLCKSAQWVNGCRI